MLIGKDVAKIIRKALKEAGIAIEKVEDDKDKKNDKKWKSGKQEK